MNMHEILEKLKKYKESKRISNRALAQELGTGETQISRWFAGKTNPSPLWQREMTRFLDNK